MSLAPLAGSFPNLMKESELQELDYERRILQNTDINYNNSSPEDFWKLVRQQ